MDDETSDRIGELEDELKERDARIKELKADLDEARTLVSAMEEQVQEGSEVIEAWKEAFEMRLNDSGQWEWELAWSRYDDLVEKHNELVRDWNRIVSRYNAVVAPRAAGRPLAASDTQRAEVLRLHKKGKGLSLRAIAAKTSLGIRTVRTIVEKREGTDRTAKRDAVLRKRELDRARMASWRAHKRTRDGLPRRIEETIKKGAELLKAAKGLGDVVPTRGPRRS